MRHHDSRDSESTHATASIADAFAPRRDPAPGKATLTGQLPARAPSDARIYDIARQAIEGGSARAPIQSKAVATHRARAHADTFHAVADAFSIHLPVQATGQRTAENAPDPYDIARRGVAGSGSALPHLDAIQRAFGADHDLSGVAAHVGGDAAAAADALGADAYATGNRIAFASAPDLHTAAHEAAHVVQQRAGVELHGGMGTAGDRYEQHADAVADAVVRGESVAAMLTAGASGGGTAAIQRKGAGKAKANQDDRPASTTASMMRSAATDLRNLATRLQPLNAAMLGVGVTADELVAATAAAARCADAASAYGRDAEPEEIENLAAAARELSIALPPELRKDAAVGEATTVLRQAIGDLATAAGAKLPAEPTMHKPGLDATDQATLARTLLIDAQNALDISPSGDLAKERQLYAQAATRATEKLRIAVDLIAENVPRGSRRAALAPLVDAVTERVTAVDTWVRVSGGAPDAAIAALYANERQLRELTGRPLAPRAAVGAIDVDASAARMLDGANTDGPTTVEDVRGVLETILTGAHDAIQNFSDAASDGPKAPKDKSLSEKLIGAAVSMAMASVGGSFTTAIAAGLSSTLLAKVGGEEYATKALTIVMDHGIASLPVKADDNAEMLLHRFTRTLRAQSLVARSAMLLTFNREVPKLAQAHPDALHDLVTVLNAQAGTMIKDATAGYVLAWQTLLARAVAGDPKAPTTYGDAMHPQPPSTFDADIAPGPDMRIPGVLRVEYRINRASPRTSQVHTPGRVEGISKDHLAMVQAMTARSVGDLHLNMVIQVSYEGDAAGRVEISRRPDSGEVEVAGFAGSTLTRDLSNAHHLKAYALGVAVDDPTLDRATAADALRGARMIADAVASTSSKSVLGKDEEDASP